MLLLNCVVQGIKKVSSVLSGAWVGNINLRPNLGEKNMLENSVFCLIRTHRIVSYIDI